MYVEDQNRFQIEGLASAEDAQLLLTCDRCGWDWPFVDGPISLADLEQTAGEHAEVCR